MAIRDLITPENVLSYARAGIEVARAAQRLRSQGYRSMVVPSRGAVPIMDIAKAYYRNMVRPCMSSQDRMMTASTSTLGPLTLSFQAPFTADAGKMGVSGLETSHIRKYWARTIAAITRGEVNDPNYRFYRFVRDEVCTVGHHDALEWRMRDEQLIFIDTVISGQAVSEIVEAFEEEGMTQIHYILLLDENGDRMKPLYKGRITQLERDGRATLIKIPTLFTEDQGPSVSGVWSVVIPKLMDLARGEVAFSDGVIGAGLYYVEVRQRPDQSNTALTVGSAKLSMLLFQAMHVAADLNHIAEDLDDLGVDFADDLALDSAMQISDIYRRSFDESVNLYLEHLEQHSLFDRASTQRMAAPIIMKQARAKNVDVDTSSSHCLRLHIDEDEAARLLRRFNETLRRPYWTDEDCTERAKH